MTEWTKLLPKRERRWIPHITKGVSMNTAQGTDPKGRFHMNDKTTNKRGEVSTSMSCRPHPGKHSPIPSRRDWAVTGLATLVALCLGGSAPALADPKPKIKFDMVRSAAAGSTWCRQSLDQTTSQTWAAAVLPKVAGGPGSNFISEHKPLREITPAGARASTRLG